MKTNSQCQLIHVGGRKIIEMQRIVMLLAVTNYTQIYMVDGSKLLVSYTLGKLAARFIEFENFIRPNRSVLFNANFATSSDGLVFDISLPNGKVLKQTTISRRKKNIVLSQICALGKEEREIRF
jgi:DNA-binding LytR/AlgR family response regulator